MELNSVLNCVVAVTLFGLPALAIWEISRLREYTTDRCLKLFEALRDRTEKINQALEDAAKPQFEAKYVRYKRLSNGRILLQFLRPMPNDNEHSFVREILLEDWMFSSRFLKKMDLDLNGGEK